MSFSKLKYCTARFSDKPAIITRESVTTWGELLTIVNEKAGYFAKKFSRNEIVPLLSENSREFITTVYALWKIGALPAPLNTMYSDAQIKEVLEIVGAKRIVVSKKLEKKFAFAESIPIDENFTTLKNSTAKTNENPNALILFTSGSTAFPKAVKFSFENLRANAENVVKYFNANENDAWLATLPFYHIGGFAMITRASSVCAPLVFPRSLSFENIRDALATHKPAFFSLVMTTLKRLTESGAESYEELKAVLAGGGPIDATTMRKAIGLGFPVYKVYGSTETTSMITVLSPNDFLHKPEAAGKPFGAVNVELSDDNEITVSGEQIVSGYFNNSAETTKRFKNGKFFSGDIGKFDENGFLYILGRKADFIISGGENVNLQKVKKTILSLAEISDAETFALPDREWGEKLCAVVVSSKENITETEIKRKLKEKLAAFEIPKTIYFMDEIPRDKLGKAKKKEITKSILRDENF